jgi:hypothetical protein
VAHSSRKHLLVEGHDDLHAIVQLMAVHVRWGERPNEWPVVIEPCGGIDPILAAEFIPTKLTSREVEILGVVIDANDGFDTRWNRLRHLCKPLFPSIPDILPRTGLNISNSDGKKLGIWIMPDNSSRGMMESFMTYLIPNPAQSIWVLAQQATANAVAQGARCRDVHRDKANIFTWLAWQDPPGQVIGTAFLQKALDAQAPYAASFVEWFTNLFELQAA